MAELLIATYGLSQACERFVARIKPAILLGRMSGARSRLQSGG
jgi:hypothetical protein